MKTLIVLLTFCGISQASLLTIVKDFNLFKSETNNAIANQHNEYSGLKLETGAALAKFDTRIGNIEMKLNAQAGAIAGVNNKISNQTVGRDNTQTSTVTNDTSLMREMINTYRAIIVLLIGQLCGLIAMYIRNDAKSDAWAEKMIESLTKKG